MFPVTQFFRGPNVSRDSVLQGAGYSSCVSSSGGLMLPAILLFRVPDVPCDPISKRTGCFHDLVLQGTGCFP